ncbi:MAG: diaminopimelate epimerase [Candidatus Omnitrophota bacterium]
MKGLAFTKMEGSGNDFVVIENSPQSIVHSPQILVKKICDRKYGVGADGVLFLQRTKKADVRMRIFNADGSEAEMCGNGARCAALLVARKTRKKALTIQTKAGLLLARVNRDSVRLKLTDPKDLKLDIKMQIRGKEYDLDYVNTGVPHAVMEVADIDEVPVREVGRFIRHHKIFKPAGTNVDFIKVGDNGSVSLRTYERGVEDETLACGTGSVAAAIIATLNHGRTQNRGNQAVRVVTRSGDVLKVYFRASRKKISDVWLEGSARIVFQGVVHV